MTKNEFIKAFPAFRRSPDALVNEILSSARYQAYSRDALIYSEGDDCTAIAFALSGEIRVYKIGQTGREITLYEIGPGFLRKFPVFGVFGDGKYRLQPIFVDDLAELAVEQGQKTENVIINAIGPETFTYRELAAEIGKAIGKRRPIISMPPLKGFILGKLVGFFHHDVTITHDEIRGLMADLLYTDSPPYGKTKLTEWLKDNSAYIGLRYSNELKRRYNRIKPYKML